MSTKKQNTTALTTAIITPVKVFIGIDYHKRYSVYHVLDEAGKEVTKGRIEHATPDEFGKLVKRWSQRKRGQAKKRDRIHTPLEFTDGFSRNSPNPFG